MGERVSLSASDGFELSAYLALPEVTPKGAVVVLQEIFGVNEHIREVCDGYAHEGYAALAPAIFDRVEPGVELGYGPEDIGRGADFARNKLDHGKIPLDLQAAVDYVGQYGKVGLVGYCFGGLLTWIGAASLSGVSCASGYYGGGIAGNVGLTPKIPTILHFGDQDAHIPLSDVEKVRSAHPDVAVYVYEADHGFNCDRRESFNEAAAQQAKKRTLDLFEQHLAG